jgi:hypothetical protein
MSLKDELHVIAPAAEVQKAYDSSNLEHAWTPGRQSAAMSMGCTLLDGVLGSVLAEFLEKKTYPNIYRDVIIVNWLTSLEPGEVNKINARLDIESAIAAAYAWVDKEKFYYGSKAYLEGLAYFTKTALDVFSSLYSVEKERSDPFPNGETSINRHGKSPSASKPRKPVVKQRAM